ncbi:MAG: non-homologous end-joining DNA ligase [Syntrophomonadaceae bacterium]|nr:non-homologous end-joining DNA ligase [Syntrophomonadaceae bacterium]MDD4550346.1 non-homologous end-joining DNA ligase [Syntrophomonadaceae bacterium]
MSNQKVKIDDYSFELSNLDKIIWPQEGYTKGDMIKYYTEIAPFILKHLQNRPMVFTRYPDGIEGKHFYQKNAPRYLPDWINTFNWYSQESMRNIKFILAEEKATLAWLANQACIVMHPWLSTTSNLEYPDFAILDIDPSPGSLYTDVIKISLVIKDLLDELNLISFLKTSGAKGLHIYIPIDNTYTYADIRQFTNTVASLIVRLLPAIATIERTVDNRGDKIYIDYLQNVKGKTLCSVYSLRAEHGATVSTPLNWNEVSHVMPTDFTIKTIFPRLQTVGDLFAPVLTNKQSLTYAFQKLGLIQK